jgi:catalase
LDQQAEASCPTDLSSSVLCWENLFRLKEKQIGHFLKADPAYGRGVAEGLGINVEHLVPQEPVLASD